MQFTPYLSFQGQCAEAMGLYAAIFGGTPAIQTFASRAGEGGMPELPPEQQDWVIHADLTLPDGSKLLASDMPPQFGGEAQAGVSIMVSFPTADKARAVFDRLAEGGAVQMAFATTFFSPGFGMCRDRFGTSWMVTTAESL